MSSGSGQYFITDQSVAMALVPNADWCAAKLTGYDVGANGALVAGAKEVAGGRVTVENGTGLAEYFAGMGAAEQVVQTTTGVQVTAFVAPSSPAGFSKSDRQIETMVARDYARILADPLSTNCPPNRAGLLMRARSALRAGATPRPARLGVGYTATDVEPVSRKLPYAQYFDIEDMTLRHRRFDGTMSTPVVRSVLRSADAVTVLPYDPINDSVVLIEQFRPGVFARGDGNPWILEPVAGRCDGDEPVEDVARREMIEEAGLDLIGLESIGNYYPTPGCLTEYLYSFVGLVDLTDVQPGVHGLDSEGEDIRTHMIAFDAAMDLLSSGEAANGPLILSLYWLMAHRTRLRQAASAA